MKIRTTLFALTALASPAVLMPAAPAAAQALTAGQILNDYNVVVFGNTSENSEVDGKVFIGGNLTGGGNFDTHNVQASSFPALTVGGTISTSYLNLNGAGGLIAGSGLSSSVNNNGNGNIYVKGNISGVNLNIQNGVSVYATGNAVNSSININNAGNNLYLGGTKINSNVNVNGGAGFHQNSSVPASVVPDVAAETQSMKTTMTAYSKALAGLAANSSITDVGGTATFTANPGKNGVAVFDITNAAQFFAATNQIQFSLNGAKEVVIDVSGAGSGTLALDANFLNGIATKLGIDTVWNFTDAKNINVMAQFGGDILAVDADVTTWGNIEGTLIANALTQNAEIHYDGANNNLVSPVPVPGALPLFGAALTGLAGFGVARRRRSNG